MRQDLGRTWWHDAVIYEVYPRSFADADGDGEGDLVGLVSRLPYLAELGVDAIWVAPWYPSPLADGGYDVSDYRDIHPLLGTLADAEALVAAAHEHGLRVIIDLVANHTSAEHPWFAAAALDAGSAERGRYFFRDGRGARRRPAAEQLDQCLRRQRLEPHRGRLRHARAVVSAHLRPRAARSRLDQRRTSSRSSTTS